MIIVRDIISTNILKTYPRDVSPSGGMTETHGGASMFNILSQKRCTKCGEWKNKSEFNKRQRNKDGLDGWCRACANANTNNHAATHREYYKQKASEWYANADNAEKAKKRGRERYYSDPEKYREIERQRIAADPEWNRARVKEWVANNPERAKEQHRTRRARKSGSDGKITAQEWEALKAFYNYTCLCCRKQEPEIELTLDHVIPLALGGAHSIDNAQPLCRLCNNRKYTKVIDYR